MNFGDLKTRLLNLIGRAPADVCYELVTADINQKLRVTDMEATATLVEAAEITLPTDFLEVIDIYRDTDPRTTLRSLSPQSLNVSYESSGAPMFYTITDGSMRLTPSPDGTENIQLRYYAKLADLSEDSDTNDILTNYPAVYTYGALAHHGALIRDNNAINWYQAYDQAMRQAKTADQNKRYGLAPRVRPRVVA
jgi:hypothetical protein